MGNVAGLCAPDRIVVFGHLPGKLHLVKRQSRHIAEAMPDLLLHSHISVPGFVKGSAHPRRSFGCWIGLFWACVADLVILLALLRALRDVLRRLHIIPLGFGDLWRLRFFLTGG